MTIRSTLVTFAALTLITACTPLQQAPLVYSSKVIVGVDVSANANDAQGVSINLGVKSVDAAYVPVAVSKEGQTTIDKLEATYGKQTIKQTLEQVPGSKAKFDHLLKSKQDLTQAVNKRDSLATSKGLADPATQNAEQDVILKQAQLAKSEKDFIDMVSLLQTPRTDAMSTYGSFSSESDGAKDNASLNVGKVFSTGVASQHLTEAVKLSAIYANQTQCLEQQNKLIALADDADKPALAKLAIENCTPK